MISLPSFIRLLSASLVCACAAEPIVAKPDAAVTVADIQRVIGPVENTFTSLPGGHWAATSAPLMGNGDMGVCILGQPDNLAFVLGKNDFWHFKLRDGETSALSFGSLKLNIPGIKGAALQFTQKPADATIGGSLTLPDGTRLDIATFVGATDNVLSIRLIAQGKALAGEARLESDAHRFKHETHSGTDQGIGWTTCVFTHDVDIATGASAALRMIGANGPKFILEPGKPVTLLVSMKSNFDAKDHLAAAKQLAKKADVGVLQAGHSAWWAGFWGKSLVEVGDPELMRRYYTAQYVLASASRNPLFPPGIIGPWITSNGKIFANGAYWMNYNHAAPFYGLYSSNHLEQADPQDAPILQFMERGREYAKDCLKMRGVLFPVGIGPLGFDINYETKQFGGTNVEGGKALTWGQRSDAAYNLVNMGMRWRSTYDPAYGKKIYPFTLAVVDFWEDYLKLEGDRYVINDDSVQEGTGYNKNPIISLGLVRNAFHLALEMSEDFGVDQGRRAKWRDILARMSDYPTQDRSGKTIFILSEKGPVLWGDNTLHIQHIYPSGQLGLDSDPKLLEVAGNTLAATPRWFDQNGSNSFLPMAARIGHDPQALLGNLRRYPMGSNGFYAGNPHGIENCSTVPNTLNEMLMQSHEGVLRIFPVWPKDKDARFVNLRAYGAFLVSAGKNGDPQPNAVRILSERGRDCTVVNPWPATKVRVFRNGKAAESVSGDRFILKTRAGEMLLLGPAGSSPAELTDALTLPPSTPAVALDGQIQLVSPVLLTASKSITLRGVEQARIFLTLDGSRPTQNSARYSTPLNIKPPCELRVLAVEPGHGGRLSQWTFPAPDAQLANTLSGDNDVARLQIRDFYPSEQPQCFETAPSDGRLPMPGKHGILRLHPKDPQTPVLIERLVNIPGAGMRPKLRITTSADPNEGGSFHVMQAGVCVNGIDTIWFKEEKISAPADGWKTFEYDLSPYAAQTVILRIKTGSAGTWHNNRAYFDEISVVTE